MKLADFAGESLGDGEACWEMMRDVGGSWCGRGVDAEGYVDAGFRWPCESLFSSQSTRPRSLPFQVDRLDLRRPSPGAFFDRST